jgi:hypothetical protein
MKYTVDMGSGAMICVPSLIKICLDVQKLVMGIQTHRQHGDLLSLLLFLRIRKVGYQCTVHN